VFPHLLSLTAGVTMQLLGQLDRWFFFSRSDPECPSSAARTRNRARTGG